MYVSAYLVCSWRRSRLLFELVKKHVVYPTRLEIIKEGFDWSRDLVARDLLARDQLKPSSEIILLKWNRDDLVTQSFQKWREFRTETGYFKDMYYMPHI